MLSKNQKGFTVVELIVIVAVIAIISAIVFVGYSQVRNNGLDSKRAADLKILSESTRLWSATTNIKPENSGTGSSGGGFGWVYANSYALSLETLLIQGGYIESEVRDPVIPLGTGSYMFYRCSTSTINDRNRTYGFFARMSNTNQAGNKLNEWQALGCTMGPVTSYTMNYVHIMKL